MTIKGCTTAPTAAATPRRREIFYEDSSDFRWPHTPGDPGETKTGRKTDTLPTRFYEMDRRLVFGVLRSTPTCRSSSKKQKDFDLPHRARSRTRDAGAHACQGKKAGVETRGISDHHFIPLRSISVDPNGYVIELTAKVRVWLQSAIPI